MSSNTSTGPANNMRSYSGEDLVKTIHHGQPIKTTDEDLFNWDPIADGIKRRLTSKHLGENPIVVGLYGGWGSGKSSLMKLVELKIQQDVVESDTSSQATPEQPIVECDCEGGRQLDATIERTNLWFRSQIRIHGRLFRLVWEMVGCLWARGWRRLRGSSSSERVSPPVTPPSQTMPIIVRFNPWYFKGDVALISAFLEEIASKLEGSGVMDRQMIAELLRHYAKSLVTLASFTAIAADFTGVSLTVSHAGKAFSDAVSKVVPALNHTADSFDKGTLSLQSQREKLVEALRLAQTRIVVLIDDIDRLYPDDMLTMMKLVRLVGDLPYMSYLLAFDDKVVAGCLEKAALLGGTGQTGFGYLEKIVQVSERVPAHSDQQLLKTALAGLQSALHARQPEDRDIHRALLEDIWVPAFGYRLKNLRQVGRLLNACQSAVGSSPDSSDKFLIVLVESLGVLYPELRVLLDLCAEKIVQCLGEPLRSASPSGGHEDFFERLRSSNTYDFNESTYKVWCDFTEAVRVYLVVQKPANIASTILRDAMNRGIPVHRPVSGPLTEKLRPVRSKPELWVEQHLAKYDDIIDALRDFSHLSRDVVTQHGGGVDLVLMALLNQVPNEMGALVYDARHLERASLIEDLLGRGIGGLVSGLPNYLSPMERRDRLVPGGSMWLLADAIRGRCVKSARFCWGLLDGFKTRQVRRHQAKEGNVNERALLDCLDGICSIIVSVFDLGRFPSSWFLEGVSDAFCDVMSTCLTTGAGGIMRREGLLKSIEAREGEALRWFVVMYFGRGISKLSSAERWLVEISEVIDVDYLWAKTRAEKFTMSTLVDESISELQKLPDDDRAMTLFAYAYKRSRHNTPHAPN